MNRLHALLRVLLAGFLAALVFLPAAYAQSNAFSVQGRLTNADGTPVPDGTYEIAFSLSDSETGTPIWSETHNVPIQNGLFQAILGSDNPIPAGGPVAAEELTLDFRSIQIDAAVQLTAVPFALVAQSLGENALQAGENITLERQDDGSVVVAAATLLIPVFHVDFDNDSPLEGDGTEENPLRVADGGITEAKLADGSVTGAKIADGVIRGSGTVTVSRVEDVSDGVWIDIGVPISQTVGPLTGDGTSESPLSLIDGGVTSEKLADEAVTEEKLDDEAVTEDKIADGAVAGAKLDGRVIEAGDGIQVTRTNNGSFEIAVKRGAAFRVNQALDAEEAPVLPGVVASLEPMAVYNGNATLDAQGEAWVALPINVVGFSDEVRYQITAIGAPGPNLYVAEERTGNRFKIAGGAPGMKVSWQVTEVR